MMKAALFGFSAPIIFAAIIVFAMWVTGSTFGQRCSRAFPADPARQELCVYNLNNGKAP